MDLKKLKTINPIEKITEQTVATLTEPIQPQYLLLTLEQYNKIAQYFSTVGSSVVKTTDLISALPTHRDLNDLVARTLRPGLWEMRETAVNRMDSMKSSVEDRLRQQTDTLKSQLHTEFEQMREETKARDLTPWKLKLKWAAVGATLPLAACFLLLTWR